MKETDLFLLLIALIMLYAVVSEYVSDKKYITNFWKNYTANDLVWETGKNKEETEAKKQSVYEGGEVVAL